MNCGTQKIMASVMMRICACSSTAKLRYQCGAMCTPRIRRRNGLKQLLSDGVVDEAFITIASFMNASSKLHDHTHDVLLRFVSLEARSEADAYVLACWRYLGIAVSMLALLQELDPIWDTRDERLYVSDTVQADRRWFDKLHVIIMTCRRLFKWSPARWRRIVRSGKLLHAQLDHG